MKRAMDSARTANAISVVSLIVAIASCYYAYKAGEYNREVYAGERREEVIALLKQDIADMEGMAGFCDEVLKKANYKLPNEQVIELSDERKTLREALEWAEKRLSECEKDTTTDPAYWLRKKRLLLDMHAQMVKWQLTVEPFRHELGLGVEKK